MKNIRFRAYDLRILKYWDFIEIIDFGLEIITILNKGDEYPTEIPFKYIELHQIITS